MVATLVSHKIDYAVIGGIANLIWGEVRATRDLDLSVNVSGIGIEKFSAVAGGLGASVVENSIDFAERSRILPVKLHDGVIVDFMLATLPFELDAIKRAEIVDYEGLQIRVVGPEDLIIYKIVSDRPQDLIDIIGILRRQKELQIGDLGRKVESWANELADDAILERWRSATQQAGRENKELET